MSGCDHVTTGIESYTNGSCTSAINVGFASTVALGLQNPVEGPEPQFPPREGTTPTQQKCITLAYILYLLEFHNPEISEEDALENYRNNFNACYPS